MQLIDSRSSPSPKAIGFFNAAFFLSGCAALIYEASWTRQIGCLVGHTASASSIVLASIFLGMAIGYEVGSRIASSRSPIFLYCIAEAAVSFWAFVVPVLMSSADTPIVLGLLSHSSPLVQFFARCLFCILLLLPATISLGLTLPAMSKVLESGEAKGTRLATVAYAWNTAGASIGMILGLFYLISYFGVIGSSFLAACLSLVAGILAFAVPVQWRSDIAVGDKQLPGVEEYSVADYENSLFAALFGFGTIALQILYLRMFALIFHNSTYTFGVVVAVFLLSLALGAHLSAWIVRHCAPRQLIGWIAFATAALIPASACAFVVLTGLEYFVGGESFFSYLVSALLLVFIVSFVPVVLFGMLLPTLWQASSGFGNRTRIISRLTMVNTIGSAIGALSAQMVIVPALGLWNSFLVIGLLFGVLAVVSFTRLRLKYIAWVSTLLIAAAFGTSRIYLLQWSQPRSLTQEQILCRWESSYGWIDVIEDKRTSERKIRQNLHYRLGATGNRAVRERRQALIPLLLHDKPKSVLFLGAETGVTASGALMHKDVSQITIVELIPEVVEAARLLADGNSSVLDQDKVVVEIDDARHFLRRTEKKFDVIVSDLFVPWESNSGYLYTVEQYKLVRDRLGQEGVFCQWLPVYQLGINDFETIADSFASVFPSTTLWWAQIDGKRPILGIVGSSRALNLKNEQVQNRLQQIKDLEQDPFLSSEYVFMDLVIGSWRNRNSLLNTDEFPRVEFQAPVSQANHKLLSGPTFEEYFEGCLVRLDDQTFEERSKGQRKRLQRFLLFGK